MAKQPAPVSLTGGSGFSYEDFVAGRFVVDMLRGLPPFGSEFGQIVRIDWQARESGRLLDDLVVTLEGADGEHVAECSIKSDRQVTSAGFPSNFATAAWEQWSHAISSSFDRECDLLVLVTGEVANTVIEAWHTLLRESLATEPARMVRRLQERVDRDQGAQSSEAERSLFISLHRTEAKDVFGPPDRLATVKVVRRIRLLQFDFQREPSRDVGRALADCQDLLRSGDLAEAEKLWIDIVGLAARNRVVGGTLDLAGLLSELRPSFELADHPDFRADWQVLERASREFLDEVSMEITGVSSLERREEVESLANALANVGICVIAGESGCGKSALAKRLGESRYYRTVSLSPEALEAGAASRLEHQLGVRHPLLDILRASPDSCLLILDSMERYSERGLRLAGRIIADILADERSRHVHVLLAMQIDKVTGVISRLQDAGVEQSLLGYTPIAFPPETVIGEILQNVPGVPWATLHHDLRPLLRNLKILDWVVRAAQSGGDLNAPKIAGIIQLIDYLWDRWIRTDLDRLSRSELLKRLGATEASTLSSGIPLSGLAQSDLPHLEDLTASALLSQRNERVRFSHDLLGDWARLKVLIGEDPTTSSEGLVRGASARWHRALRLFGRWLLSQADGVQRWSQALTRADNGTAEGTIVRDLLLESVVVAENSYQLLKLAWRVLITGDGRLLKRLLDRFLFVATIPDLRIPKLLKGQSTSPQLQVAFRVPLWSYWGAVLKTLDEHIDEICAIDPTEAVRICHMWLDKTPAEGQPGTGFPWRVEAARVALRLAREIQARIDERAHVKGEAAKTAFEAALLSAHEFPEEVEAISLELAGRTPLSPEVQSRADAARIAKEDEMRRWIMENPDLARQRREMFTRVLPPGPMRGPWPDGPERKVVGAFREAILDSQTLTSLALARPATALELLLAVCIEPPGETPAYYSSSRDDCGTESWPNGAPPIYFRGPFLQFMRACPEQGVEFVIRIVNFATARWTETETRYRSRRGPSPFPGEEDAELSTVVRVDDDDRNWLGDRRVFRWSLDWPLDCPIISSSLMALEKWLYEQLEAGSDIEEWLLQIMRRSESVAFAGMLIDVGKRKTSYFAQCLRPLLGVSAFHLWDSRILMERSREPVGLLAWWNQPRDLVKLAREWHTLPHRRRELSRVAVRLMHDSPEMDAYFAGCREHWRTELSADGEPILLQLLIEHLNPCNWTETPLDDGRVRVEFVASQELLQQVEPVQAVANESQQLLAFPMTCRSVLDGKKSVTKDDLPSFWKTLQEIAAKSVKGTDGESLRHDAIAGGVAVLFTRHREWLDAQPDRLAWCLTQLQRIVSNPPGRREFEFPDSGSNWNWECFIAEVGVCLLKESPESSIARQLVASGIVAFHYETTARTVRIAYQSRRALGDDFQRILHLAIRWSAVRRLGETSGHFLDFMQNWDGADPESVALLRTETERWESECVNIIDDFVQRSGKEMTLRQVVALGAAEAERLELIRFPGRQTKSPLPSRENRYRPRRKVRRTSTGLDGKILHAAFAWIDLSTAETEIERSAIIRQVRELLELVLTSLDVSLDDDADENEIDFDGLPDDLDAWVFECAACVIAQMRTDEQPKSLWQPILSLGLYAHKWIERFFWYWFSNGVRAASTPGIFCQRWTEMLQFALESSPWDHESTWRHHVDEIVNELLGYHFGLDSMARDEQFARHLEEMATILDTAAQRWFIFPTVANSFARNVVEPGYDRLLCHGVRWLNRAVTRPKANGYWRKANFESNLISVLDRCWQAHHQTVCTDRELQTAFMGLLTMLSARGSHAAMALKDKIIDSIPQQ